MCASAVVENGDSITRGTNKNVVMATPRAFSGIEVLMNLVGIFDYFEGVSEFDCSGDEGQHQENGIQEDRYLGSLLMQP